MAMRRSQQGGMTSFSKACASPRQSGTSSMQVIQRVYHSYCQLGLTSPNACCALSLLQRSSKHSLRVHAQ
eukprot:6586710-Karenia_brevis.AAC.1